MEDFKEILKKKSEESDPLIESIENKEDNESVLISQKIVNEEGKDVIVFEDPLYSKERKSIINYSVFRGKWEFENLDDIDGEEENCAVRFTPEKENSSFIVAFKSVKDRVEFFDSIYSDNQMRQTGSGMSLEKLANSKVLKATGGLVGLSVLGYGLFKLIKGKKE